MLRAGHSHGSNMNRVRMGGWGMDMQRAKRKTTASWLLQKKAVCKDKGRKGSGGGAVFIFHPHPPHLGRN